jgi:hypothetical protein
MWEREQERYAGIFSITLAVHGLVPSANNTGCNLSTSVRMHADLAMRIIDETWTNEIFIRR